MRELLAPPNLLTLVRIAMTPLIVLAVLQGGCARALALSTIAGATDAADGFLARRFGWNTRLGLYLDPVADKLLLTSLYVCLGAAGLLPTWLVALVAGRDVLIVLLVIAGMLLTNHREFPPTIWGKVSTVIQIAGAIVFLAACAWPDEIPSMLRPTAILCVAVATAWSGIVYAARAATIARAPFDAKFPRR